MKAWLAPQSPEGQRVEILTLGQQPAPAIARELTSDLVGNESVIPGDSISDALDALAGAIGGSLNSDQVANVSTVPGSSVSDALEGTAAGVASVTAAVAALDSSDVDNASGVSGATVTAALDTLLTNVNNVLDTIGGLDSSDITNVSAVSGATVTAALTALSTALASLTSSLIANASTVTGATVTQALDTLQAGVVRAADVAFGSTADGVSVGAGAIGAHIFTAVDPGDVVINASNGLAISAGLAAGYSAASTGQLYMEASSIKLATGASSTERFEIGSNGSWQIGNNAFGSLGYVIQSKGSSLPPEWGPLVLESLGSSLPTASAALTNLTAGATTIAANTSALRHTWEAVYDWEFVHTAAATPTITAEWVYGGVVVASHVITPASTAGTFHGRHVGRFRFQSVGAAGTGVATIRTANPVGLALADQIGGSSTQLVALDTTVSKTLEFRIRMTTGVASNVLTLYNATLERLIN